jgi:hypothetical protein
VSDGNWQMIAWYAAGECAKRKQRQCLEAAVYAWESALFLPLSQEKWRSAWKAAAVAAHAWASAVKAAETAESSTAPSTPTREINPGAELQAEHAASIAAGFHITMDNKIREARGLDDSAGS